MRKLSAHRGFAFFTLFLFIGQFSRTAFTATTFRIHNDEQQQKKQNQYQYLQQQQQILSSNGQNTGSQLQMFVDMVESSGYTAEEHDVTTDDGYILSTHRISGGPKSPVTPGKPVVLLIHGLFAASDIWILRGPGKDLAYLLCDEGYDVWLLNTRGNFYGKRHKRLSPKESKFWRFSWHESGVHDAAATIDYILKTTGLEKLSLLGHSMGTTIELVLLSMKPAYNEKVNVVLSFAPVAIFTHVLPGLVSTLGIRYGKQLQKTFQLLGMHEIFPRSSSAVGVYSSLCEGPRIEYFCRKLFFNLIGLTNADNFDTNMIPTMLKHFPQGTSIETVLHYRQIIISGKFSQYDFGPERNVILYKNMTPPEYSLENITSPVILYYGPNDAYTTREDVMVLRSKLPNATSRQVPFEMFSHLDFLFSNDSKRLLYNDVMNVLKNHVDDTRINETQP